MYSKAYDDIHKMCYINSDWKFILEEEGCESIINNAIETWEKIKHIFPDGPEPTLNQKIVKYFEVQTLKLNDIL